ncbi:YcnI family copper-binding membrane protein [Paenibacillus sp. BAC0078]
MNQLLRKLMTLAAPAAALLLVLATMASAHVTVSPAESATGAWETYTLKVPSEKDAATIQVDLRIPEGAEFKQYEAAPGWDVTIEGNKVSWIANGKGIQAGQFQRFYFTAKNPDAAGELAWNAYQHYADGSVVQWSGEEGSETPHSITEIVQAAGGDSHAHGSMDDHSSMNMGAETDKAQEKPATPAAVYVALGVSILSLLLSIAGLFRSPHA